MYTHTLVVFFNSINKKKSMFLLIICVICALLFVLFSVFLIVVAMYTPFSATERLMYPNFTFGTDATLYSVENMKDRYHVPLLKHAVQVQMQELLQKVVGWLEEANIRFWLVRSSMLAAVRHGSLMPWNDEMDIAIEHKDLAKLIGVRANMGGDDDDDIELKKVQGGYHFCRKNVASFPFVTIFIAKAVDKELVACTPLSDLGQCTFADSHKRRREIYETDDVFPLRKVTLNHVHVYVPRNAEKCLDILYGGDNERWRHTIFKRSSWPLFFCNTWTSRVVRTLCGFRH